MYREENNKRLKRIAKKIRKEIDEILDFMDDNRSLDRDHKIAVLSAFISDLYSRPDKVRIAAFSKYDINALSEPCKTLLVCENQLTTELVDLEDSLKDEQAWLAAKDIIKKEAIAINQFYVTAHQLGRHDQVRQLKDKLEELSWRNDLEYVDNPVLQRFVNELKSGLNDELRELIYVGVPVNVRMLIVDDDRLAERERLENQRDAILVFFDSLPALAGVQARVKALAAEIKALDLRGTALHHDNMDVYQALVQLKDDMQVVMKALLMNTQRLEDWLINQVDELSSVGSSYDDARNIERVMLNAERDHVMAVLNVMDRDVLARLMAHVSSRQVEELLDHVNVIAKANKQKQDAFEHAMKRSNTSCPYRLFKLEEGHVLKRRTRSKGANTGQHESDRVADVGAQVKRSTF